MKGSGDGWSAIDATISKLDTSAKGRVDARGVTFILLRVTRGGIIELSVIKETVIRKMFQVFLDKIY